MEKLENENVSLAFQVQSLVKERENIKLEYQNLFDSIKKTRVQSQEEINELIENVNQKTYSYGDVRAKNQDLLITISELKTKLKNIEKDATSVRRPLSRGSSSKISVLLNTKNHSEDVEVSVRTNKKTNVTSKKNVIQTKKIVISVDVKNAPKANDVLCVSCDKNVLTPFHDKCLAKYKLNVNSNVRRALFTTPRTEKYKSLDTTYVVTKTSRTNVVIQIVLWIVDNSCSKHMTGNLKLLKNFVEKFMETVCFGNDHFAAITGYGDYVHGNITICHVYYVEGLGHNLFSVGQFYDGDLEVAFRSKTCYVRNLEGDDLLNGARNSNLYTISITDMTASSPVCMMSKATSTKSWYNKTLYELLRGRKPNVEYFHVFGSLCYPTNDRKDLEKMKPKANIGIFIGYSESSRGFQIYNHRTRKIMETIHVKFDELTTMASEHNYLEPGTNRFQDNDSSAEDTYIPSKEDLDNLFGPMYEEYFEKISPKEAPPNVSSSKDHLSLISSSNAVESVQEDSTKFDGNTLFTSYDAPTFEEVVSSSIAEDPSNMHKFHQVQQ
ncbi:integrase, catalytic region, zinc finger, CCHC-type containing protein [Tanacetum coccineum]